MNGSRMLVLALAGVLTVTALAEVGHASVTFAYCGYIGGSMYENSLAIAVDGAAAADFSRASLRRLATRADLPQDNLLLVDADATRLPFAAAGFDRVAAFSVVCFLPTAELRRRFLDEIDRVLKPTGIAVISTYHYAPVKRLWAALGRTDGALREGFHSQGSIWYRNETRAELVASLAERFTVEEVRGVCHRVPVVSRLSRRLSRALDGSSAVPGPPPRCSPPSSSHAAASAPQATPDPARKCLLELPFPAPHASLVAATLKRFEDRTEESFDALRAQRARRRRRARAARASCVACVAPRQGG